MALLVKVHEIAKDGLPSERMVEDGRVAFLYDGCILSGNPMSSGSDDTPWEAEIAVSNYAPFKDVTHWVEFPIPLYNIERKDLKSENAPPSDQFDYEPYRREDQSIDLREVLSAVLGPAGQSINSAMASAAARQHLRDVEEMHPITSRQAASVAIAQAVQIFRDRS